MMNPAAILLFIVLSAAPVSAESTRWYAYEEGILASGIDSKPILLDFYADWCPPCIAMEEGTYPDPKVVSAMRDLIAVKVDTQKRIDLETKYGVEYYPTVVLLNAKGKEIARHIGYLGPDEMVGFIKESRGKPPKESPGFGVLYLLLAYISLYIVKRKETADKRR